jgi:DNA polymerase
MAYCTEDGKRGVWYPGQPVPEEFRSEAELWAWNAQFERVIWDNILVPRYGFPSVPLERWRCSMATAAYNALPLHLADAGEALQADVQKDKEGQALMRRISKMQSKDISADEMRALSAYCMRDVEAEMSIMRHKAVKQMPISEIRVWQDDQIMNSVGLRYDRHLVEFLLDLTQTERAAMEAQLAELTGGRITSLHQHTALVRWLNEHGLPVNAADKNTLSAVETDDEAVRAVLDLRLSGAKSSVAKLEAILNYGAADDRLRGLFQYHGASTGRWAGRGPQLQNFPRAVPEPPVDEALWEDRAELVQKLRASGGVLPWVSASLRSCIIASQFASLYVADYSQIETRILAWLAKEPTLLAVLNRGEDPYVSFAAAMYRVDPSAVTKAQRQVAKSAVLGLGYSMGSQKYRDYAATYGAELTHEEAERVVATYRATYHRIPRLWRDLEYGFARCAARGEEVQVSYVRFVPHGQNVLCVLPSGRCLTYWRVHVQDDYVITYERRVEGGKWGRRRIFGGLLTENIVQAISRDVLVHGMRCVKDAGFEVVGTVHDEIIAENEPGKLALFLDALRSVPSWCSSILLPVEGRETFRWSK